MRLRFPAWSAPLLFLLVCGISFGVFAPFLGFYQDDWHHIYYASRSGFAGLRELFLYDTRPNAAYVYGAAFALLGFKPLAWHVFLALIRWLTVCAFWATLRRILPGRELEAVLAALLFAVYPVFKLQALSVAYSVHWVCYLTYMLSLWLMAEAFRSRRLFWLLYPLSVLLSAAHLFTMEYFAGLELLRPLVLWVLLADDSLPALKRIGRTLLAWAPYLAATGVFVVWRAFLLKVPTADHTNAPLMLYALFTSPLSTALKLVQMALQDFIALTFSPWHAVFNAGVFSLENPFERLTLLGILAAFAGLAFILLRYGPPADDGQAKSAWWKTALLLGAAATVLGPVPGWMIGEQISTQNPLWSDRLGLAAMAGAALFVVALLERLIPKRRAFVLLVCAMTALSIGWHLRTGNDYRWEWQKQKNFYWQLAWRAPQIAEHTPILADGELFHYMGYYPTSFAINSMYAPAPGNAGAAAWFFGLYKSFSENDNLEQLLHGKTLREEKFSIKFRGASRDSLVLNYKPDSSRCLWLLRPQDGDILALPYITRHAAGLSNLERIVMQPAYSSHFRDIYGEEPPHDWCFTFQQADLARQQGDWEAVMSLWEDAQGRSLKPAHPAEVLPFLDAQLAMKRWDEALETTLTAYDASAPLRSTLCARWWKVGAETEATQARDDTLTRVETRLECGKLK